MKENEGLFLVDMEVEAEVEIEEDAELIQTEESLIKEKYVNGQFKIVRTSMDFPLNNITQIIEDESYLKINPAYQRRNRWDKKKKSLLIESLIMNVPIPPIFLFEKDYNSYEVMDGLQRLKTIHDYLSNKFKLIGLEYWRELNGKYFSELPELIKKGLYRRTISAIVLLAESSKEIDNTDVRLILFNRLNTGGVQLNPQELRNALFPGVFNEMILEISRQKTFTDIWKIPEKEEKEDSEPSEKLIKNGLYKTMGDCEIVLRYFAIKEAYCLKKSAKINIMLDRCMKNHLLDSAEKIEELRSEYLFNLSELKKIFGENIFVLPGSKKVSIPMYDAFMIAYSLIQDKCEIESSEVINELLDNYLKIPMFYEILTGKLGTTQSIWDRIELACDVLKGRTRNE